MSDENRNQMNNNPGGGPSGNHNGGNNGGNGGNKNNNNLNRSMLLVCLFSSLVMLFGFFFVEGQIKDRTTKEITYDEFVTYGNYTEEPAV